MKACAVIMQLPPSLSLPPNAISASVGSAVHWQAMAPGLRYLGGQRLGRVTGRRMPMAPAVIFDVGIRASVGHGVGA